MKKEEKEYPWGYEAPVPESEVKRLPPDERRCTAWSKRNKRRCAKWSVKGSHVCEMHGAYSLSGMNHPKVKKAIAEGRREDALKYAKSTPSRMMKAYMDGLNNPEIASHVDEIALIEARIVDIMEQSDEGGAGVLWREAKKHYGEHKRWKGVNNKLAEKAFEELGEILMSGNHEIDAWKQVGTLIEQRRKLAQSHHSQLVQANQYVSVAQVIEILANVATAIGDIVDDPHKVERIMRVIGHQMEQQPAGQQQVSVEVIEG